MAARAVVTIGLARSFRSVLRFSVLSFLSCLLWPNGPAAADGTQYPPMSRFCAAKRLQGEADAVVVWERLKGQDLANVPVPHEPTARPR